MRLASRVMDNRILAYQDRMRPVGSIPYIEEIDHLVRVGVLMAVVKAVGGVEARVIIGRNNFHVRVLGFDGVVDHLVAVG